MNLSWVIPTYKEEERIEKSVRAVDAYLKSKNFPEGYEIIIADSSSPDRTAQIVKNLQSEMSAIKFISVINKGKGWGVKQGMLLAKGEIRCFADADNSVSPEQAEKFIPLICNGAQKPCFDVVIGSIEVPGAVIQENAQWYRRMLGKFSKYLIRAISGLWDIHDSQRGFKFFSGRAADAVFRKQTLTGWGFDFEILLAAKRTGFSIKEVPVIWINPAGSKVGLGAYFTTLMELFKIKLNDLSGVYR